MFYNLGFSKFDLSGKRVRYAGCVLDKCSLSLKIHEVASQRGYCYFPLATDIFWDSYTYSFLRSELFRFLNYNFQQ